MAQIKNGTVQSKSRAFALRPQSPYYAVLLFVSILAPLLCSRSVNSDQPTVADENQPILDWLEADQRFGKFLALLKSAGLESSLFEPAPTTLFVPTDSAFEEYSEEALALLTTKDNRSELAQVLRYHAIAGSWTLEQLGQRVRIESKQGQDLALRWLGGENYSIDTARINEPDVRCQNGLVHVIDDLLLPTGISAAIQLRPATSGPQTYEVDLDHSSVLFRIMHMEVGAMWGWFRKFEGEFTLDEDEMSNTSISLTVDVGSIDTANQARDAYLQTPDFFDAKQYPKLTFKSSSVKRAPKGRLLVSGKLTFRGITLPVTFEARKLGEGRFGPDWYKIGYEAELTFLRSDFGMTFGIPGVAGDEVRLVIALEGGRAY